MYKINVNLRNEHQDTNSTGRETAHIDFSTWTILVEQQLFVVVRISCTVSLLRFLLGP